MTRAPSYTYLWPRRRSFRGTEVGLVREIVSAIGDWWSLIGQVTFPLHFSRVIPPTPALCCGPAPKGSLLLTEKFCSPSPFRDLHSPFRSKLRLRPRPIFESLVDAMQVNKYRVSRTILERKERRKKGRRGANDLEGWDLLTGRIYPLGHRGFELLVQQVALSGLPATRPSPLYSYHVNAPYRLPPIFHPSASPDERRQRGNERGYYLWKGRGGGGERETEKEKKERRRWIEMGEGSTLHLF